MLRSSFFFSGQRLDLLAEPVPTPLQPDAPCAAVPVHRSRADFHKVVHTVRIGKAMDEHSPECSFDAH
jgi:hypothetical protein